MRSPPESAAVEAKSRFAQPLSARSILSPLAGSLTESFSRASSWAHSLSPRGRRQQPLAESLNEAPADAERSRPNSVSSWSSRSSWKREGGHGFFKREPIPRDVTVSQGKEASPTDFEFQVVIPRRQPDLGLVFFGVILARGPALVITELAPGDSVVNDWNSQCGAHSQERQKLTQDHIIIEVNGLRSSHQAMTRSLQFPGQAVKLGVLRPKVIDLQLTKEPRESLGLSIEFERNHFGLLVTGIVDGLVKRWNESNPSEAVRPGDVIVEVCGARGTAKHLLELVAFYELNISLRLLRDPMT